MFVRSILETNCTVWNSGLNSKNIRDLERVQKYALRIILSKKYINYEQALLMIDLDPLTIRREALCLKLAKKSLKNKKHKNMFPLKQKIHQMSTRCAEKYFVNKSKHARAQKSPII